jgi:general L-amino acid transport system permease protein
MGCGRTALGCAAAFLLRHIVLPQALRVIIPPMTSQYLNLTKNSSLAGRGRLPGRRVDRQHDAEPDRPGDRRPSRSIMMVFLTISLGISLFMNWYNARIALVER